LRTLLGDRSHEAQLGQTEHMTCLVFSFHPTCSAQQGEASRLPAQTTQTVQTDKPHTPLVVFDRQMPISIDEKSAASIHQVADTLNNDKEAYVVVVVGDTTHDPCDREVPEQAAIIRQSLVQKGRVAPERVKLMTTPSKEMTAELHLVSRGSTFDRENLLPLERRIEMCKLLTSYRCVHSEAVKALSSGRSLNDKEAYGVRQSCGFQLLAGRATYKRLIAESENALAQLAPRVHVTVEAAPENCSVKYKPVVGGQYLDGGMTTVGADIEPKSLVSG
jgi:hypothetical protein